MAFFNPAGAFLFKVISPKLLIGVGSGIGVLAMVLGANTATFSQFILCFSALYGVGIGLCYLAPLGCGWEWIPENRGFVTGIILGAFGFGAFIFSFIALSIVNPENVAAEKLADGRLMYSAEIAARVPNLLYVLAMCFAGLGLISVLLIRRNPAYVQQQSVITAD